MLISFFNPSDLIGCGGDITQSDSFRYAEGVCGGDMWRGDVEGVRGGVRREGYLEGVCGGGMQRGYKEGGTWRGYAEGVCGGGMWRGVTPIN